MDVVLVNPALEMRSRRWFPLGIGYIASFLRNNGKKIEIVDIPGENLDRESFQKRIKSLKAKYYGIGGIFTAFNNVIAAVEYIHEIHPDAFIFAGNTVAYSAPELLMSQCHVNAIVMGEGEVTTLELINAINNGVDLKNVKGIMFKDGDGKMHINEEREPIENLDALPFPAWDMLPIKKYFKKTNTRYCVISTVRGCPYNCIYCCKTFMGYKIRYRSAESIFAELLEFHRLFGMDIFYFFDDLSLINKNRILKFCELKKGSKLNKMPWTLSARVNSIDDEIAIALKESNCLDIAFGIESFDQNILDAINKKVKLDQITQAIDICNKHGLKYAGSSFMIGMPGETEETVKVSRDFAQNHNMRYEPHYMTPFPSTKLYSDAINKGLIKDELGYVRKLADQGNTNFLLVNMTETLSDQTLVELREKYLFFPERSERKKRSVKSITEALKKVMKSGGPLGVIKKVYARVTHKKYSGSFEKLSNIWE
ncbi:MAG: radical SAM protein [Spirochaetaceae bacterium]|nr:MAG: radical SAM protein [Spirochaetaceae bacterium]